jgi:primosomal protein N''
MGPNYILSKRWHLNWVGGNGRNCWCIEITNLNHSKEDAGYQNPFKINEHLFRERREEFERFFPQIYPEYDALIKEVEALPAYDEAARAAFLARK